MHYIFQTRSASNDWNMWKSINSYIFQWYDVLLVVLLLVDDDVSVDEEVVEEEELPGLELLPAGLGEDALAHQDPAGHAQGLARVPEAALHESDASGVGLRIHCNIGMAETFVSGHVRFLIFVGHTS